MVLWAQTADTCALLKACANNHPAYETQVKGQCTQGTKGTNGSSILVQHRMQLQSMIHTSQDPQKQKKKCTRKGTIEVTIKLEIFPAQMEHMAACQEPTHVTMSRFHSPGHVTVHRHMFKKTGTWLYPETSKLHIQTRSCNIIRGQVQLQIQANQNKMCG